MYTHRVVTDDNGPMYYVGVTCQKLSERWKPSAYRTGSLWPYIEKYGWENIEHSVFADGLDYDMARKLEDTLILLYRHFDCCINKLRSGLIEVTDKTGYTRNYMSYYRRQKKTDPEWNEHQRQIDAKYHRNKRSNDLEYVERNRQYMRDRYNTPEGKIYDRVKGFNRRHPDLAVESPLEARNKYLSTGYIPEYIKQDDLI